MTCDRFHLLQEILHFSGKENFSYDPNDGRRDYYHQLSSFSNMKLCRKLCHLKKQLRIDKSLALFKFQLHFKQCIKTKKGCFENFISLHHQIV